MNRFSKYLNSSPLVALVVIVGVFVVGSVQF